MIGWDERQMPRGKGLKPSIWEQLTKNEPHYSSVETRLAASPAAPPSTKFSGDKLFSMSVIRQLACVVWLTASAFAGAGVSPNIILITVDTVRADRMGFLGSKLGLTPNLDTFSRESMVFTHAYSQVPLTAPSHATILTGTYPQFHQVNDFQVPLAPELPYAPAILRKHRYRTSAFIGAMVLDPHAGFARGFDRGFDTYDAGFHQAREGEDRYHSTERRGGEVVAHALAWLNQHPRGPFFMWLHLYDAHDPYDPPEPYKSKYASAPYDGEIAYVDSAVGKFLSDLRTRGLYDGALIAVMADHGEALGEHGEDTHGFFLYDETIHVPLMIKLPGAASATKDSAGTKIENRVGLVDVLPTILQAVRIPVPPEVQGESLLGMLLAKPATVESAGTSAAPGPSPDRPAYAETDYPQNTYGWSPLGALRTGKYLYIKAPRQELYDQTVDPKAEHDLSSASTAATGTLAAQLDVFRQKTSSSREAPKFLVDPEAQAKLSALGYVATYSNASKAAKERGADPKDKIEIGNLIHRTYLLIEDQRYQEAVPLLRQLIAKEPDTPLAYAQLGQCFVSLKEYPQAVPVLRKAVELRPDMTLPHFQLGVALLETRDIAGAVPELETVVARVPRWEEAHLLLQMAYAQTDRMPEAIKECEKVLAFDPDHYGTNLLLGRVLELTGKPAAALPRLKKAAALDPKAFEPHMFLAEAYGQLGRKTDAARERTAAKRLGMSDQ
jgi:arylsulfatase A-like enzyme/Tfp pilus assembly protein PilF